MHKTGETVAVQFCVSDPATGGLVNADAPGPTGALIVNGVANAATVTVTAISTGVYSASVTLPTITDGDELQIRIAATVATVAGGGIVWSGLGCTKRPADVAADVASALAPLAVLVTDWTDGGRLDLLLDAAAGGAGGSHAQTVTVTCGGVAVQDATVQILDAADDSVIDTGTTNSSGVVVVRCNALSIKITAVKAGYASYTSAATSVTGAADRTITLTAIATPTVSNPGYTTLYGTVYGSANQPLASATVYLQLYSLPDGDTGHILCDDARPAVSNGVGYAEWLNCIPGATYVVYRSTGAKKYVVVGTAATQEVTSCMGPA